MYLYTPAGLGIGPGLLRRRSFFLFTEYSLLDSLPSSTSIYLHSLLLVHHEYRPLLITAGTTCPPQSLPTRPAAELLELYSVAIQLQFTARMDSHAIRDRDSGMFGESTYS